MLTPPTPQEISRWALFATASDDVLSRLAADSRRICIDDGQHLFTRNTVANCFYGVVEGAIQLSVSSSDGQTKVLEIIRRNQTLGEAVMFLGRRFPVDAQALEDTVVIQVPASTMNELLDVDPSFARGMLASLSMKLHSFVRDVEMYTTHPSRDRVVDYMVASAQWDADQRLGRGTFFPSKRVVASRLGITPETLSRILRELVREKLITLDGPGYVIVDADALRSAAL